MRILRDERGLIVNWLVKLLIGFAIFAVVAYDAGSIMVNYFTLDQAAKDIANELHVDGLDGRNTAVQLQLEERGKELAATVDARLTFFELTPEGDVRLQLRRRADTVIVKRISAIKDWARATADTEIRDVP